MLELRPTVEEVGVASGAIDVGAEEEEDPGVRCTRMDEGGRGILRTAVEDRGGTRVDRGEEVREGRGCSG